MNSLTQLLFVCAVFLGISCQCPSEYQLTPCTCFWYNGACTITCTRAVQRDIDRIAAIYNLCGGNIHFVLDHGTGDIPAKLWRTLLQSSTVDVTIKYSTLQHLVSSDTIGEVSNDGVHTIGNRSTDGVHTIGKRSTDGVATIRFLHTVVGNWNWNQFTNFNPNGGLNLIVDTSPMNELDSEFMTIAEGHVHSILIQSSGLTRIQDNEFVPFDVLNTLSLQYNGLTSIYRSMFARPAKNLQFLNLNGNKLDNLEVDMFTDMPALEAVNLRDNKLKSVPTDLLRVISRTLKRIVFDNNPWICDCYLLSFLDSSHIFLSMGTCASPEELANKPISDLHNLIRC